MKNCPYLAFLNSHLCCFHPASIMCLDLFPRRASFLSTDSFFGSLYFYCLCMMLGFSCCLYLYILLSLYLIGQLLGQTTGEHFVMKLNNLISENQFHIPFTSLLILYYFHCCYSFDFALAFPTRVQIQAALFRPVLTNPNSIFLHLNQHLFNPNYFSFQKLLSLVSFEQFEAGFQNILLDFELNRFHQEASFHT